MLTLADVRWLLQAVHPAPGPLPPLDPDRHHAVVALAHHHRLTPLLASRTALTGFSPELAAPLRQHAAHVAARNLAFTRELLAILKAAGQTGIPLIPFKGPVLAVQAYGSLALREFDDLDLLTARTHLPAAAHTLETLGYKLVHTGRHAASAIHLRTEYHFPFQHPVTGCCVELHAGVAPAGFAQPSWRLLRDHLSTANLGGAEVAVLNPSALFLVLCVHATKHLWGCLEFLTALAHLIHRNPPDWLELERCARLSGTERFLATALSLLDEWTPAPLPDSLPRAPLSGPSLPGSWIDPPASPAALRRPAFHLRAHTPGPRRLKYLAGALLAPNWDDFRWLPLPRRLQFLYPLVRFARLVSVQIPSLLRFFTRKGP